MPKIMLQNVWWKQTYTGSLIDQMTLYDSTASCSTGSFENSWNHRDYETLKFIPLLVFLKAAKLDVKAPLWRGLENIPPKP